VTRTCGHRSDRGEVCRAAPLKGEGFCLFHHPERQQEAQEARRLGGLRRKRETTVAGVYDFAGLETVTDIRRLLEIATVDTLALENSVARSRTLAYLAQSAIKMLQVGELEDRVHALEAAVSGRRVAAKSLFDSGPDDVAADFGEAA
jgi:hypothetical protein